MYHSSAFRFYCVRICKGALRSHNSVCLSVCQSHAWIVINLNGTLQIFWYHTKGQSLCYSDTNSDWWATLPCLWNMHLKWSIPFEKRRLRQISTYNVSSVTDNEKTSIMTNIQSTTGFPTSYGWSAYVTHKPKEGGSKSIFSFFE